MRARRLGAHLRALLELFLLPGAIALLPWRLGHRVARLASRWRWLYREQVALATAQAQAYGCCDDPRAFAREQRYERLVDHTDLQLSRSRSDRFLARHVDLVGAWPEGNAPLLALTFHWGGGHWGIRSLAATGRRIACLSAPFDRKPPRGLSIAQRYGYQRLAEVVRSAGAELIFAGVSGRPFYRALQRGESLLALIDVPPGEVGGGHPVTLLGRPAQLPSGLVKLAQSTQLPVVMFAVETDRTTGRRRVHVSEEFRVSDRDAAMRRVAAELERLLLLRPAAWQFWNLADAFFQRPVDAASPAPAALAADDAPHLV